MRPMNSSCPLQISGKAEVIAARMSTERRREALYRHNPRAIYIAAEAMAALDSVLNGSTPSVRCDMSERMRRFQLDGSEKMETPDLAAIADENEKGLEGVLEWCRTFLRMIGTGYGIHPLEVAPIPVREAQLALIRDEAALQQDIVGEAPCEQLRRDAERVRMDTMKLEAAIDHDSAEKRRRDADEVCRRVEAHRRLRKS